MRKPIAPRRARGLALRALALGATVLLAASPTLSQAQAVPAPAHAAVRAQEHAAASAAAADLARFIQHQQQDHADGLPRHFPLAVSNTAELAQARIGPGFAVYTVDPADILSGRADLGGAAKPTGTWRYVIRVGQRAIGLSTVERVNGAWQVVSYGGAQLAQDVDAQQRLHGNADRSNLRFIRVYQARSDFLEVVSPQDGRARLAPLHSARVSLRMPPAPGSLAANASPASALVEQADVMPALRAAVQANLAAFQ